MRQAQKNNSFNAWLEHFILAQLIKQLNISSNTKKLVLYKSFQLRKGLNTDEKRTK